jgi:radical SAM superfamily enzyme with C-terminal helix-hairpin-helix motif
VKLPILLPKGSFLDAVVVAHRERSIIALPFPISINTLSKKALEYIPGIGKRAAGDILLKRPFENIEQLAVIAPSLDERIKKLIAYR